jgi:hypothetical protein
MLLARWSKIVNALPENPSCCPAMVWHMTLFMELVNTVDELQDIARTLAIMSDDLTHVAQVVGQRKSMDLLTGFVVR